ncbi:MAG: MarR family winged helix-turn-helix transcriptional regulator [Pseudodesulfovibrio sp.]|uniref:MarR family winged helix-turn-helix transcriptional regulator n=1 Tax=Pseudodesulfovibrio sp. TaxID=2035812 RepID=UPI003D11A6EA
MQAIRRTPANEALTSLVLDLFRLNNRMLAAGDGLVAGLGLTSARWQVLGTIVAAEQPRPVAWLARDMGRKRQNVQRIVNDLAEIGLVDFAPNPHHRRASLVVLTDKGGHAFDEAMRLQVPWFNRLAEGIPLDDIEATRRTMRTLHQRLAGDPDGE